MLQVKTKISASPIHGIGLFAEESIAEGTIAEGTIIWTFTPNFDMKIALDMAENLPQEAQSFLKFYGYISKSSEQIILPTDHARFTNHSENPNCDSQYKNNDEVITVALRDIQPGEEITEDYGRFEKSAELF